MSRDSGKANRRGRASPFATIPHVMVFGLTAISTGSMFWILLAGLAASLLLVKIHRWMRSRQPADERPATRAAPNPFGQ